MFRTRGDAKRKRRNTGTSAFTPKQSIVVAATGAGKKNIEADIARILLAELEKDRSRRAQDVEKVFRLAIEHPEYQQKNPLTPHPLRKE